MATNENGAGERRKHKLDLPPPLNLGGDRLHTTSEATGMSYTATNTTGNSMPEYKNVREYARALHPWLYQYRVWSTISSLPSMLPYKMMNCVPPVNPIFNSPSSIGGIPGQPTTGVPQSQMGGVPGRTTPIVTQGQGRTTVHAGINVHVGLTVRATKDADTRPLKA